MRRQDLGQQRLRIARNRFALDAHPGLDQVTAVEELEAARAQVLEHVLERHAAIVRSLAQPPARQDQQERQAFSRVEWRFVVPGADLHCIAPKRVLEVGRGKHRLERRERRQVPDIAVQDHGCRTLLRRLGDS